MTAICLEADKLFACFLVGYRLRYDHVLFQFGCPSKTGAVGHGYCSKLSITSHLYDPKLAWPICSFVCFCMFLFYKGLSEILSGYVVSFWHFVSWIFSGIHKTLRVPEKGYYQWVVLARIWRGTFCVSWQLGHSSGSASIQMLGWPRGFCRESSAEDTELKYRIEYSSNSHWTWRKIRNGKCLCCRLLTRGQ